MMIPSNYQINISKAAYVKAGVKAHHRHYALVELGPHIDEDTARERFADFCQRFREEHGFNLELTRVECSGKVYATSG